MFHFCWKITAFEASQLQFIDSYSVAPIELARTWFNYCFMNIENKIILQQKLHVYLVETIPSTFTRTNTIILRSYWVLYQIISVGKRSIVCCSPFQAISQIQPYRLISRLDKMLTFSMWKTVLIFDSVELKFDYSFQTLLFQQISSFFSISWHSTAQNENAILHVYS